RLQSVRTTGQTVKATGQRTGQPAQAGPDPWRVRPSGDADGGSPGLAVVGAEPAEVLADGERLVATLPEAGGGKPRGRPVVEELLDPQAAGSADDLEAERAAVVLVPVGAPLLAHGVGAPRRGLGPEAEDLDPQSGRQVRRPKDHEVAPGLCFFPGYGAE